MEVVHHSVFGAGYWGAGLPGPKFQPKNRKNRSGQQTAKNYAEFGAIIGNIHDAGVPHHNICGRY